jgi:hypothetical protein
MLWRVSMAGVATDGPFSGFPGFDRHLMVLSGDGMILDDCPSGPILMEGTLRPVSFSGDWPVSARLIGGPVQDFNLFARRDILNSRLTVHHVGSGGHITGPGERGVIHVLAGQGMVDGARLSAGDSVLVETWDRMEIAALMGQSLRLAIAAVSSKAQ